MNCLSPKTVQRISTLNLETLELKKRMNFSAPVEFLNENETSEIITLPCGKCLSCRFDNAKEWTYRVLSEKKRLPKPFNEFFNSIFMTLTIKEEIYQELDKKHALKWLQAEWQKSAKRMRRDGYVFKYLIAFEHGRKSVRAHAHVCLLFEKGQIQFSTAQRYKRGFINTMLDKYWTHGFCPVSVLTPENIAYTVSYSLKKCDPKHLKNLDALGYELPFMNTSNGFAKRESYAIAQTLKEKVKDVDLPYYSALYTLWQKKGITDLLTEEFECFSDDRYNIFCYTITDPHTRLPKLIKLPCPRYIKIKIREALEETCEDFFMDFFDYLKQLKSLDDAFKREYVDLTHYCALNHSPNPEFITQSNYDWELYKYERRLQKQEEFMQKSKLFNKGEL